MIILISLSLVSLYRVTSDLASIAMTHGIHFYARVVSCTIEKKISIAIENVELLHSVFPNTCTFKLGKKHSKDERIWKEIKRTRILKSRLTD